MPRNHTSRTKTLALALVAGLAVPVFAQTGTSPGVTDDRNAPKDRPREVQPTARQDTRARINANDDRNATLMQFHTASSLIGRDVENMNDEVIASIEDLVFDRGSGRIEHAVLKSGAVLGIGGKSVAVPFSRLGYDANDNRFTLDMTKEQLQRSAEFLPEDWEDSDQTTWAEDLGDWWEGVTNDDRDNTARDLRNTDDRNWFDWDDDRSREAISRGEKHSIQGEVVSVDRQPGRSNAEHVVVTVRTDDGETKELVFGPSWYVMGQEAAPMRGDKIDAEVRSMPGDAQNRLVVISADVNGRDLTLRDEDYRPRWRADDRDDNTARDRDAVRRDRDLAQNDRDAVRRDRDLDRDQDRARASQPGTPAAEVAMGRLMLVSDLVGAKAVARNDPKSEGEVQNVIIDARSGRIALIGFDPNENFLGMADDIKVVPWSIVQVISKDHVRIDADREMLLAAESMPNDVTVLATPGRLDPIYSTYRVQPRSYDANDRAVRRDGDQRHTMDPAWGHDGQIVQNFRDGEEVSFSGTVKDVRMVSLVAGSEPTKVLVVSTNEGDKNVVLAPSWYLDRQSVNLEKGSRVSIEGKRGQIEGRDYVAAWSVDANGSRLSFWNEDGPVWDGD